MTTQQELGILYGGHPTGASGQVLFKLWGQGKWKEETSAAWSIFNLLYKDKKESVEVLQAKSSFLSLKMLVSFVKIFFCYLFKILYSLKKNPQEYLL